MKTDTDRDVVVILTGNEKLDKTVVDHAKTLSEEIDVVNPHSLNYDTQLEKLSKTILEIQNENKYLHLTLLNVHTALNEYIEFGDKTK